jgi:hypothetical protein
MRHKGIKATRQRGNEVAETALVFHFRLSPYALRLKAYIRWWLSLQLPCGICIPFSNFQIFKFSNFQIFKFSN